MLTIVRAAHGACCDGISTVDAALSEKMARRDSHESELRALGERVRSPDAELLGRRRSLRGQD